MESVLRANGGARANTTMQCLSKYAEQLRVEIGKKTMDGHGGWEALSSEQQKAVTAEIDALELRVVHVTGMFCPVMLCEKRPRAYVHSRNGTFLGYVCGGDGAVYAKCSECRAVNNEWTHLTEEGLKGLLSGAKDGSGQCFPCL